MPKIMKMPKPPPKAGKGNNHRKGRHPTASKTAAMAEIILFPKGRNEIPFIPSSQTDPDTKMRWLHLADDALDGRPKRKKV